MSPGLVVWRAYADVAAQFPAAGGRADTRRIGRAFAGRPQRPLARSRRPRRQVCLPWRAARARAAPASLNTRSDRSEVASRSRPERTHGKGRERDGMAVATLGNGEAGSRGKGGAGWAGGPGGCKPAPDIAVARMRGKAERAATSGHLVRERATARVPEQPVPPREAAARCQQVDRSTPREIRGSPAQRGVNRV